MSAISEAGDPVSAAEEQPKLAPASKPKRRPTRVIKLRISGLAMSAESAAGARPSSPIPSGKTSAGKTSAGKTSEGRDASTAAGNRNVGGDAVQPASPSLVKPQGEAASPSV